MNFCSSIRAADALLRSLGGALSLRLPANVAVSGTASELGLASPLFEDIAISPVVVRARNGTQAGAVFDLLVSASAVTAIAADRNAQSADALFSSALGFVYNDGLLRIETVTSDDFAGTPYLYRITATLRSVIAVNF